MEVSRRLRIAPDTVRTRRRRFIEHGLDGLGDEPRPVSLGRSLSGGSPSSPRRSPSAQSTAPSKPSNATSGHG
ncbi:hypothetical protein OG432_13605 [Streptomyces sp. NBC_00442]|uniref:helix-turn-helix domain-containing protein n=1 Tax=Streptomyces sp. NBC_00442 TaxID=2903651 RepID=UPI002E1CC394